MVDSHEASIRPKDIDHVGPLPFVGRGRRAQECDDFGAIHPLERMLHKEAGDHVGPLARLQVSISPPPLIKRRLRSAAGQEKAGDEKGAHMRMLSASLNVRNGGKADSARIASRKVLYRSISSQSEPVPFAWRGVRREAAKRKSVCLGTDRQRESGRRRPLLAPRQVLGLRSVLKRIG